MTAKFKGIVRVVAGHEVPAPLIDLNALLRPQGYKVVSSRNGTSCKPQRAATAAGLQGVCRSRRPIQVVEAAPHRRERGSPSVVVRTRREARVPPNEDAYGAAHASRARRRDRGRGRPNPTRARARVCAVGTDGGGKQVRLYVLRALQLAAMDMNLWGRPGKSDPYLEAGASGDAWRA